MLTERQKETVITKICGLIRESMLENDFYENFYQEKKDKKKKKSKNDDNDEEHGSKSENETKRVEVMTWLGSAQNLHSVLAYKLYPDLDEDSARSEFSKKFRGEDASGNEYSFSDDEINELYNMKEDYIKRAGGEV